LTLEAPTFRESFDRVTRPHGGDRPHPHPRTSTTRARGRRHARARDRGDVPDADVVIVAVGVGGGLSPASRRRSDTVSVWSPSSRSFSTARPSMQRVSKRPPSKPVEKKKMRVDRRRLNATAAWSPTARSSAGTWSAVPRHPETRSKGVPLSCLRAHQAGRRARRAAAALRSYQARSLPKNPVIVVSGGQRIHPNRPLVSWTRD